MATKSHNYRGISIEPCQWAGNPHNGRWAIRVLHHTGLRWTDENCPHAWTLTEAKAKIDEIVLDTTMWDDLN